MPDPFGPVEYIVIHFDSDRFGADIVPALNDLLDQGLVRLIDIAAVAKSADGEISIMETQELSPEVAAAFQRLTGELSPLLSEADLQELARASPPALPPPRSSSSTSGPPASPRRSAPPTAGSSSPSASPTR
jgi:hypothetical protein